MKEFNLEAALNGEPVKLRSGRKAYVVGKIPSNLTYPDNELLNYPLIGVILNKTGYLTGVEVHWTINGKVFEDSKMHDADIICMYEEPKISIEDLPKPFYPEESNGYFYISDGKVAYNLYHPKYSESSVQIASNGQSFRTREDAQKWIDFMKSMME
nr:MAG TPA: hypothetical protein [Bacteriophage sp.]